MHSISLVVLVMVAIGCSATTCPHCNMADLPPLLDFSNGTQVKTLAAWEQRKTQLRALLEGTFYGAAPAANQTPPITAVATLSKKHLRGYTSLDVNVTWARCPVGLQIFVPETCSDTARCPLFLTQTTHRRWAVAGIQRGYVGAVYAGADSSDATDCFRRLFNSSAQVTWGLIRLPNPSPPHTGCAIDPVSPLSNFCF